jgi:DNA-binding protein HU-beta
MPSETAFTFVEAAGFSCDEPPLNPLKMTKVELQSAWLINGSYDPMDDGRSRVWSGRCGVDSSGARRVTDKKTAGVFLDTLSDIAYKATKKNGEFVVPGFGKLVKQKRKARTGINSSTKQKIKIPAKTVLKFRAAKVAKDAILGVKK